NGGGGRCHCGDGGGRCHCGDGGGRCHCGDGGALRYRCRFCCNCC
ncbi:unnamed protein product, partial [Rotaria sp. Silwood2]